MTDSPAPREQPASSTPETPDGCRRLRAWGAEGPPRGWEDRLHEKPLALCVSGGGFRSFGCVVGQLRALHDLGLLDRVGLISGVSGGAWAALAYAFAPGGPRDRLGRSLEPDRLTHEGLADAIDEAHLARPITTLDAVALARELRNDVPTDRLFSRFLGRQLLGALGIDADRAWLCGGGEHEADLRARNPDLAPDTLIGPQPGRPSVVANASLLLDGPEGQRYLPVELSPACASLVAPDDSELTAIETAAVLGDPQLPLRPGELDVCFPRGPLDLSDLLAATGSAYGGVLVQVARSVGLEPRELVLAAGRWMDRDDITPFLVDGGYVENLGLLAALRRGADRLIVFVNGAGSLGWQLSPWSVSGLEAQLARLFGVAPSLGIYAGSPLPLFEAQELPRLADSLRASKEEGDVPWALLRHRIREDNPFGLEPREVTILWHVNEASPRWVSRLPAETRSAFTSPFGALRNALHLPVAFAQGGYPFRLTAAQLALQGAVHDAALRALPESVWDALLT